MPANVLSAPKVHSQLNRSRPRSIIVPGRIPKIIHMFWIGHCIPDRIHQFVERCRYMHKGWEVKLWHGIPQEMNRYFREIMYTCKWLTCRSDVFRWWALYEFGGIYLDTDVYMLKRLDPLLIHDHFIAAPWRKGRGIAIGALGSAQRHRLFRLILNELDVVHKIVLESDSHSRIAYGPMLVKTVIDRKPFPINHLPMHYFYLLQEYTEAINFVDGTSKVRADIINRFQHKISDDVMPYGIHVSGLSRDPCTEISSHKEWTVSRWDKALVELTNNVQTGCIFTDDARKMTPYLLGHLPKTNLVVPDQNLTQLDFVIVERGSDLVIPRNLLKSDGKILYLDKEYQT